jgi:hypothetical protein
MANVNSGIKPAPITVNVQDTVQISDAAQDPVLQYSILQPNRRPPHPRQPLGLNQLNRQLLYQE